jgi:pilus assembly protein CpaB
MKSKSLALLLLALGCGLVASLGITQVLAKRGDSTPSDTTPVYVATAEIPTGSLVNEENVKLEQWPKDRVPAEALTRTEDFNGRHARQKIYVGEPLIEPKLLGRDEGAIEIPKGLRVVAISVSPEAIHNGLVLPNSRCDLQVLINANPALGVSEAICKTVLQDIRVFAVNDVTSTEAKDAKGPETRSIPTGKTVSLLVTPAQAQIVTLASHMGTIRLIMRRNDDSEQTKTRDMTPHELLGAFGGGDRAKEDPLAAEKKAFQEWADSVRKSLKEAAKTPPAKANPGDDYQRFTIRVRTGAGGRSKAEVNDFLLINNSNVQGLGDEGAWTAISMGPNQHGGSSAETHSPAPVEPEPTTAPATVPSPKSGPETPAPPAKPASPRSSGS